MKRMACMVAQVSVCLVALSPVHARESRREVMQSCAQQAQDKRLVGDERAAFMRGCLHPVEGYKPPAFVKAGPQPLADTSDLTEPTPTPATPTTGSAGAKKR